MCISMSSPEKWSLELLESEYYWGLAWCKFQRKSFKAISAQMQPVEDERVFGESIKGWLRVSCADLESVTLKVRWHVCRLTEATELISNPRPTPQTLSISFSNPTLPVRPNLYSTLCVYLYNHPHFLCRSENRNPQILWRSNELLGNQRVFFLGGNFSSLRSGQLDCRHYELSLIITDDKG